MSLAQSTTDICEYLQQRCDSHFVQSMSFRARLTCQPATRPTGRAKQGSESPGGLGGPLIGHKLDTGWQGRLLQSHYHDFGQIVWHKHHFVT